VKDIGRPLPLDFKDLLAKNGVSIQKVDEINTASLELALPDDDGTTE
jgi:hypothetical protein